MARQKCLHLAAAKVMTMRKVSILALISGVVFGAVKGPAWAKPKTAIAVEVVNIVAALSHSPSYHPAVPHTSTTVCTPNSEKCTPHLALR